MSKSRFTHGQGLIEYGLILILVVVLCVGVIWGGKALIDLWTKDDTTNEATSTQEVQPVITNEDSIKQFVETNVTIELVDTEVSVTDNCNNSTVTEYQSQRKRIVEHLVLVETEAGITIGEVEIQAIPLLQLLKLQLEGHYNVQDKQVEEQTYSITFTTAANKKATHTVEWKYTWKEGEVVVNLADGTTKIYKYKVRTTLDPSITSIEQPCQ